MDPITIAMGLAQIAPDVIRWISGNDKAADAAERVVSVAQAVTGLQTGDAALDMLRADPGAAMAFRQRIAELAAEMDRAYLADRQDARKRDVELARMGNHNSRANWMIIGDCVGLIVCLGTLTFVPELPGEVRGIISTIAGFFGLGLRDAHQFEFGSSRGSQEKQKLLNER